MTGSRESEPAGPEAVPSNRATGGGVAATESSANPAEYGKQGYDRQSPPLGIAGLSNVPSAVAVSLDPSSDTESDSFLELPAELRGGYSNHEGDVKEPLLSQTGLQPEPAAQPHGRADNVLRGMLWYGASSFFFAGMGICSKLLGTSGYPVWEITFFRAIIILFFSLSVLIKAGDSPWGNRRGLLILRGTLGYGSITCYFVACQLLPLADATTLTFLGPLIVALFAPFVLRERASAATFVVIPLCVVGVVLITQPAVVFGSAARTLSILGILVGLLQPFFSASAKMTVRFLRTTEKTNVMVFYLMVCTLVYSTIGCVLTWRQLVTPRTWLEVGLLFGQGLFGYGNQICITKGLANAKAASVMCMQYFSIVISQLAGMFLFGEFTSLLGNLGMVVIVLSMAVYVWSQSGSRGR